MRSSIQPTLVYDCHPVYGFGATRKLRSKYDAGQSVPRLAQNVDTAGCAQNSFGAISDS